MRHLRRHLRYTAIGTVSTLTLLLGAQPAPASLVRSMDLVELTENAGRVVVGEVLSVRSNWDKGHRWIYTTIELQVAEIWKGETPRNGRMKVVQPGGSVGDIEMHVHGLRGFPARRAGGPVSEPGGAGLDRRPGTGPPPAAVRQPQAPLDGGPGRSLGGLASGDRGAGREGRSRRPKTGCCPSKICAAACATLVRPMKTRAGTCALLRPAGAAGTSGPAGAYVRTMTEIGPRHALAQSAPHHRRSVHGEPPGLPR